MAKLEVGRQLYNACLGESMRRLHLVRQSKLYRYAKSLPKTKKINGESKPNPERTKAFSEAWQFYDFSEYGIHSYVTTVRKSWIGSHIDADSAQTIATRAFKAAKKVMFGVAKRVRFKGANQFDSIEGKSVRSPLKWSNEKELLLWGGKGCKHLALTPRIDRNDPVMLHGLNSPVKFSRIVRRKQGGKNRFFAQLVNRGVSFKKPKNKVGNQVVGLDIGPSTIARVGEDAAVLEPFCTDLKDISQHVKRIQKKLSRSARMNNPDCFQPSRCDLPKPGQKHGKRKLGKSVKGKRHSVRSNSYQRLRLQKAELERKLAAHRKSLQGELVNKIVAMGCTINTEKLSYKAWQKMFGRSVGRNAPGMFIARLKQIAESAGGYLNEFPTRNTKLSQRCLCGTFKKKPLRERVHQCSCGITAQRDLFSGYLARFVDLEGQFQAEPAIGGFEGVDSLLASAWNDAHSKHKQSSIGSPIRTSTVLATTAAERIDLKQFKTHSAKTSDDVGPVQLSLFREPMRG